VRHKFEDELRIKVDHDHEIDPEVVERIIDKAVEGAVTIIVVATAAHILRRSLSR
jgi:hypothetical protein